MRLVVVCNYYFAELSGFNLRAAPIRKGARTCLCTASCSLPTALGRQQLRQRDSGKETLIKMSDDPERGNQDEAERKFWRTPELLENLLHFLDPESTYHLAQAHDLTKTVLQGKYVWNKFIRRSCPRPAGSSDDVWKALVALLKLMKNPSSHLLDLLDVICDRFSPDDVGGSVHMSCQRHPDGHFVSFEGLLVLEAIEGACGSAEQNVEAIAGEVEGNPRGSILDDTLLSALSARLVRQQKMMSSVSMIHIVIGEERMVEAFKSFLEFCPAEGTTRLSVKMSSEGGGWEWGALAGAMSSYPNIVFCIEISKQLLGEGAEEEIRHVWEGIACLVVYWEQFSRTAHGEEAYERLIQVKGMTELEWEQSAFGEEDDGEEDEEEDEGDGVEDGGEEEEDQDEEEFDAEQAE